MSAIQIEKFRISIFGFEIYRTVLVNDCVQHYCLGLPIWFSHSPCSVLWHKADAFKDFNTRALDKEVQKLAHSLPFNPPVPEKPTRRRIAYLATELYETGGHSKLVRDSAYLLNGAAEQKLFLVRLFTTKRQYASGLLSQLERIMPIFGIDAFWTILNTHWSFKKNVTTIASAILRYNPTTLFVYSHPNDSRAVAILALVKRHSKIRIAYVPHASHRPNLGITLADIVPNALPSVTKFYESNLNFTNICESRSFLLTRLNDSASIDDAHKAQLKTDIGIPTGAPCTMSGASSFKFFENDGSSPYFNLIKRLLERNPDVYHVILSNFSPWQQEAIDAIFGSSPSRARLLFQPFRTDYRDVFSCATVFIDSFPMSSALTMVELMQLKVPYVVKINRQNSLLSFHEYQQDGFPYMYESDEQLLLGVETLLRDGTERKRIANSNLAFFKETYSEDACRNALLKLIDEI